MITGLAFHENVDVGNTALVVITLFAWALSFVAYKKNNKISRSSFLLEVRDKFQVERRYNTHIALKNNKKVESWADLDDYLGLFEICEIMIQNKSLISIEFKKLYGYRLQNILQNKEVVYHKLVLECDKWDNLYLLLERCFDNHKKTFRDLRNFSKNLADREQGISDERFLNIMDNLSKI
jgi:hypothetical protein